MCPRISIANRYLIRKIYKVTVLKLRKNTRIKINSRLRIIMINIREKTKFKKNRIQMVYTRKKEIKILFFNFYFQRLIKHLSYVYTFCFNFSTILLLFFSHTY